MAMRRLYRVHAGYDRGQEFRMYTQVLDPVGGSLFASAIFAALPLITLFVLLGGLKMKAHVAALIALAVALLVAVIAYEMPVGQGLNAALLGACFGLFPIMWIVWNAVWIHNKTEATGHFDVLRRSFASVSDDQRIQAVIIAFAFGALIEALAGFGAPVAITSAMLLAVGFKPIRAASVALVANTAPVAFGAIATPIITLSEITGLPKEDLGAMVGRRLVRHRPVPVLELPVGGDHRHRRFAPVRRLDRRAPARMAALAAAAHGDHRRPAGDRRRRHPRPQRTRRRSAAAATTPATRVATCSRPTRPT
jgi:hypothetical protein